MAMEPRADVLILGIGNLLLSDEGVGVHAVRSLLERGLPPGIEALDGGTSGADLVDHIAGRAKVVVIDAASGDGPPGTIYRCEAAELLRQEKALSLHEFGLADTLRMAGQLGCAPRRVVVFGIQPATLVPGLELSAVVSSALAHALELALEEALSA